MFDSRNLWYENGLERWYSTIHVTRPGGVIQRLRDRVPAWHIVFFFIILLWNDMDLYFYTSCWSVSSSRKISIQYNNTPARIHNFFWIWFSFLEAFCIRPDRISQQTRDWRFSFSVTLATWLIFTFALYLHFSVMLNSIFLWMYDSAHESFEWLCDMSQFQGFDSCLWVYQRFDSCFEYIGNFQLFHESGWLNFQVKVQKLKFLSQIDSWFPLSEFWLYIIAIITVHTNHFNTQFELEIQDWISICIRMNPNIQMTRIASDVK